ncbi:glycosyltransferase [Thalassobellus suaedae]|uniref:Glycosyltransferase n=1 Tax=Thalassobellus suaedae TaxID=3074124 RepID=A0ABY9XWB7_9FLAO|nr:glycosyltransferase [Flavobacteriaceae bacterium HL-DH14]
MKKILLIMPYGSVGGMERLALHFYNHYKSQGYQVTAIKFFKLQSDIINFKQDEYALLNKDLSELSPFKRLWFYMSAPFKLRRLIKKQHITHSIAFGDMANIFSALTNTSEFKIGSIHALKSVELNSHSMFTRIIKWSYKSIYKKLHKVVCISNAIKKDLIENCQYKFPENLEVIYNPHDITSIQSLSEEPLDTPKERALFKGQTIIFIGRLSYQKSPWHLINAFKLLIEKNENVNLIFIGDGNPEVIQYIKNQIETFNIKDRIHFLGRKTNPYKYLKQADVLALSSHFEGTPNVIVEAITLGIPIVCSNCTEGIMELMSINKYSENNKNIHVESGIITPNFYKGTLGFPEYNGLTLEEEHFSEALLQVLLDSSFKIILNKNRKALLKKFAIELSAENYLNN